ncbi:MAG: cupredoxin domain-containing protein, partial [Candidatus Methylomirabilaceae bacterium]
MKKVFSSRMTAIAVVSLFVASAMPASGQAPTEREITVVNIEFEGSKVWVPATIIAKKGEKVRVKLINKVKSDPNVHGFAIPDYNVKVDVYRDKPETVEFTVDKAGLFRIWCHLHPAHLPGQLL